ncbi:MAG: tetratricopeptide repeat protein [Thermocrinis sp.]|uniref:tetratricopeptide repeat protein n=1 Tax=Thermocrinis sp. TaxID=2024383 RepID=UPI003C097662
MQTSKRYALIRAFSIRNYVGIILTALLVAVLLFPKGRLEKYLPESVDINTDLALAYYRALLRTNPSVDIYSTLVKSYIRIGRTKDAIEVVLQMERKYPNDPEILFLKYQLLKVEYFSVRDKEQKKRIKTEMEKLLSLYIKLKTDTGSLEKAFKEAESMDIPEIAYRTSTVLAERTGDLFWIEKAFYYSIAFKNYPLALKFVDVLVEKRGKAFLKDAIDLALLSGNLQKAFDYARTYYQELPPAERHSLIKRLIEAGLTTENYLSFREYMKKSFPLTPDERLYLEKEVMKRALWAKNYETLKRLILENLYLSQSLEYRIFLLELALGTGDPYFARDVAKRLHFGNN